MRYRQLLKIAQGGMATVHIGAVEGGLGFRQFVAIKEPHRHLLEDRSYAVSLQEEARLGALLRHANVVSVRDVVQRDDGAIWLVMDYVEGVDFGQLVDGGRASGSPVSPAAVVQVVLDAAEGLAEVHELADEKGRPLGLIHRDISPQNLLIGRDGVTRVTDFGVAKFRRTEGRSTTAGKLRGKVAYMAPEYLQGQPFDARVDVFALGVVLWEGLAGTRLFRGDSEGETLLRVLSHDVPALRPLRPELPEAVDDVLLAALAKEPAQRFGSVRAFASALASATRGTLLEGSRTEVRATVERLAGRDLDARRGQLRQFYEEEPSVASLRGADRPGPTAREFAGGQEQTGPAPGEVGPPLPATPAVAGIVRGTEPVAGASLRRIVGALALLALALGGVAGALVRAPGSPPSLATQPARSQGDAAPVTVSLAPVETGPSLATPQPAPSPGDAAAPGTGSPPPSSLAPSLSSSTMPTAPPRVPAPVRSVAAPGTAKKPPPNPYGNP